MNLNDARGSAWAFRRLMQAAQDEIDRGERKGATIVHRKPNPAKTYIGWFERRLLRGEFGRRRRA